jgi:prophage regulatory protein
MTNLPDRILRLPEVCQVTGLSRSHVYSLEQQGQLPPRRRISARCSGWLLSEVMEWLRSRPLGTDEARPISERHPYMPPK